MATAVVTLQGRQMLGQRIRRDRPLVMRIAPIENGRWSLQHFLGPLAGWSSEYFYDDPLDALENLRFRASRDIVEIHCGMCFHRVDEVSYWIVNKTPLVCCRTCAERARVQSDQAVAESIGTMSAILLAIFAALIALAVAVALCRS